MGALAAVVAVPVAVWVSSSGAPEVPVLTEPKIPVPPEPEVMAGVVDRPAELDAVVNALIAAGAGTVGITTGLYGAGGFGKTTLAKMACADRRVKQRFGKFVYPVVTLGRDVRSAAAIAAKVNDVIKLVAGENATFTDPQLAGARLGSLLDAGPPALLVIDDVWEPEQLTPFLIGGKRCARLVTTRVPELLTGRSTAVRVDQMSPEQARALLTAGLPHLDEEMVSGLLAVTGRWPLLLRLVSQILADYVQVADVSAISAQGAMLLERLAVGGPAAIDELSGDQRRRLDVGQPQERARAVRATIEASTGLLDGHDAERLKELGVFAEDETVPFSLVVRLWRATADLDELRAALLCKRLTQLALVSRDSGQAGGIVLHDVIRDFLRAELGGQRLAELNDTLVKALAAELPAMSLPDRAGGCAVTVAWWALKDEDQYVWDHLIEHLQQAGQSSAADAVAGDLRWIAARLEQFGPTAPVSDLAMVGTPRAARLRGVLMRTAHLLAPTGLAGTLVDVLHSRVADDPDWGPQVAALSDSCHRPRLINRWPLPDLADPALQRVLTGHTSTTYAVAVAPDGSWLASGSYDGTVRIWDTATWNERAVVAGPDADQASVEAVAVAPDGSWLASGCDDGTVRIWDTATWNERAVLSGHTKSVEAVAVAPDGSWLASVSNDGTVRIWDTATGGERMVLTGHTERVVTVAVAPDGSWLASGSYDGTVRIWDTATWNERAVLPGHTAWVLAVAVAPDGSWLASGGYDGTVRIWDTATWNERAVLPGHTAWVLAVAVAPDGSWLASGGYDGKVRVWDTATWEEWVVLTGNAGEVVAVAVAPDGSWLASGGYDGKVRVWDTATWEEWVVLTGNAGEVVAVAVAPDGSWLATASPDGTVRIWDLAIGDEPSVLTGHARRVEAVAVAPDGSWLASGGWDRTVRIWDTATGDERTVLTGHTERVVTVAVAPDGSWLASGSWKSNTVRIWDTATWDERGILTGHTGTIWALAVAPDGSWLASGGADGTVRIWDMATWDERAVLPGHAEPVWALAVAPDGSWLASGDWDGTVRIWDTATWDQRAALTAHTKVVMTVVTAVDGSWLASGSDDGTLRIWDTATWDERAILTRDPYLVRAAVAADGSWLASISYDGTVRIWDTATWHAQALMRVDSELFACAWLKSDALALAGSAGLYLFGFLAGSGPNAGGGR